MPPRAWSPVCANFLYAFKAARNGPHAPPEAGASDRPALGRAGAIMAGVPAGRRARDEECPGPPRAGLRAEQDAGAAVGAVRVRVAVGRVGGGARSVRAAPHASRAAKNAPPLTREPPRP
jgi:hypothetical protein